MTTFSSFHSQKQAFLSSLLRFVAATFFLLVGALPQHARAAEFVKPTPEELAMTSLPGYPGVSAVILFREEITKDDMHSVEHYDRIKILTEEGKKYANVELGFASSLGDFFGTGDGKSMDGIAARTIHADGTVIPFTGKPYLKVLAKTGGFKVQQTVFTLPDVEPGSIIEYRYTTRINDNVVEPPIWRIQDELYVKEAHFAWWPTNKQVVDADDRPIDAITWLPILPPGAKIETTETPGTSLTGPTRIYQIHVKNVPPVLHEEYMPPLQSFTYRVNFAFSPYSTPQTYWQAQGKQWSKRFNSFANPNSQLKEATDKVVAGASTPEEKLRKVYAAVMALENSDFTRQHDTREDKAAGVGQLKTAADVLTRGRGTSEQLTALFIGMVRASGLEAYAMRVPDRSETIFVPGWMDTRQFDTVIAIVPYAGADHFFDPGSRYCSFGQLAWQHTMVGGLRQTAEGTSLGQTPGSMVKENRMTRVANLTLDSNDKVSGKITFTYVGAPAVRWRQAALQGDEESLRKDLREHAESLVPRTLALEIAEIKNIADYDQPLSVSYTVSGSLGTPMGKRLTVPADVFLANTTATFPQEKRESAVYFHFPELIQDAVRINYPPSLTIEAAPATASYQLLRDAAYKLDVQAGPNSVTARRDFLMGDILIPEEKYKDLRTFYSQMETKDQEQVVVNTAAKTSSAVIATGATK